METKINEPKVKTIFEEVEENGCSRMTCDSTFEDMEIKRGREGNVLSYTCPKCGTRHTKSGVMYSFNPDKKREETFKTWEVN